jgi:hypothetical protein
MSSENKYLQQQTDLLQTLRNEMRSLDTLIMNEEAKLSDAKRLVTKESLAIKFSALSELAEKMTIVGELGMVSLSSSRFCLPRLCWSLLTEVFGLSS